jgi:hypothetical protein
MTNDPNLQIAGIFPLWAICGDWFASGFGEVRRTAGH